jgi:DNA-binding IclR family transcriptional regulator
MDKENMDSNYITMVDRALKILDYIFNENKGSGISQIAVDLDLPKANIFRLLNTLDKWGFVEKDRNDKYSLGKALIKYGNKAKGNLDVLTIAEPIIKELAVQVGESVNVGIEYDQNVLTILSEQGESSVLISRLIPISPLNCSSMGKIFLSNSSEELIRNYFNTKRPEKRTISSITTVEKFLQIRNEIIESNVAYDNEEYEYGLTCIAAPIRDQEGKIVAAISVSGPTSRLKFKGIDMIVEKLKSSAQNISDNTIYIV